MHRDIAWRGTAGHERTHHAGAYLVMGGLGCWWPETAVLQFEPGVVPFTTLSGSPEPNACDSSASVVSGVAFLPPTRCSLRVATGDGRTWSASKGACARLELGLSVKRQSPADSALISSTLFHW